MKEKSIGNECVYVCLFGLLSFHLFIYLFLSSFIWTEQGGFEEREREKRELAPKVKPIRAEQSMDDNAIGVGPLDYALFDASDEDPADINDTDLFSIAFLNDCEWTQ